jgi:hypothetical protein
MTEPDEGSVSTTREQEKLEGTPQRSGWKEKVGHLLRAIGAGALSSSNPKQKWPLGEDKKVVISTSVWRALTQCCVHILPVSGSIVLFWLNFSGYYMGASLTPVTFLTNEIKLNLLQFLAKAHELLILASTATVVFCVLRHQLIFGNGLRLFSFLAVAGVISASAGPSSAILMIPQNRTWSTGVIDFYLNGTSNQLWPTKLNATHIEQGCLIPGAAFEPYCPAGGYQALDFHYRTLKMNPLMDFSFVVTDDILLDGESG